MLEIGPPLAFRSSADTTPTLPPNCVHLHEIYTPRIIVTAHLRSSRNKSNPAKRLLLAHHATPR